MNHTETTPCGATIPVNPSGHVDYCACCKHFNTDVCHPSNAVRSISMKGWLHCLDWELKAGEQQ